MSAPIPRRIEIYKHFGSIGPNTWPPERDTVLQRSRFGLNIHQDNHPFQEPLRLALFAAYGLPIISETVYDGYPWVHDETIIYSGFDGMVGKIAQVLKDDYSKFYDLGMRGRELMCEQMRFDKMVNEAVEQRLGANWR